MTDLTQQVIARNGHIEILTNNQIVYKHHGDSVTLRGPLHAMVKFVKDNGKNRFEEELILKSPNETRQVTCEEGKDPKDRYDVYITDMGALPTGPTILDLVVSKNHMDVLTTTTFVGRHDKDMIRLRGPAKFRLEYKNDKQAVIRAEDLVLNTPNDIRDFVNKKDNEDMWLTGSYIAPPAAPAPAPAPMAAPRPAAAPAPAAAGAAKYPDGSLIKTASNPAVYVVEGGKRRHIQSPAVIQKYGYNWSLVKTIPDGDMNAIPTGDPKV